MIFVILYDRGGTKRCEVVNPEKDLLMAAEHFRLYLVNEVNWDEAKPTGPGKSLLLRIASEATDNGIINAEAEALKWMAERFDEMENVLKSNKKEPVHYDWLVPKLVDTFISDQSQDLRQANLLDFPDIEAKGLFPLPKLQEYCEIDCKTAAWVLGRFLKLQCALESLGVYYAIDPAHCLIAPEVHRLIYLGFIKKFYEPDEHFPEWDGSAEARNIRVAAENVFGWIKLDAVDSDQDFVRLVRNIMAKANTAECFQGKIPFPYTSRNAWICHNNNTGLPYNGRIAHRQLYDWIGENWGYEYHPFTYYVKSEQVWKKQSTLLQF